MSEPVFMRELRLWAAKLLNQPEGEGLKTLSILSPQEVYVLSLMFTVADLLDEVAPHHAVVLRKIAENHLKLKISQDGAGRKDLKDVVNPYHIYPLYQLQQPQPLQEALEGGGPPKKKRFRLF